jgi:hypothetical protein
MNSSPEGVQRLVASEAGCHEQFKELSLLRTWDIELCLAILGPSPGRTPLPKRIQTVALHHVGVTGELTILRAAVSPTTEWVLWCLTGETSKMKVLSELAG